PAAMVARQYHAFRPTQIASKKKHAAIMDEDDEELEAELRELEREKREQEALEQSEEGLEKLDGAFKAMALIPYYNLAADDSSVYANLIRGSLIYGSEEGLRRASVTMDEYLLIDGERETPLTRRRAAEVVAAAEQLVKAYEAKGDADKASELNKHVDQWKKSI
ncbi:hypothetical protein BGZ90_008504, partial [Linnemannia elongata]